MLSFLLSGKIKQFLIAEQDFCSRRREASASCRNIEAELPLSRAFGLFYLGMAPDATSLTKLFTVFDQLNEKGGDKNDLTQGMIKLFK